MNSEQGGSPKILKSELCGNFLAFAKGYQFSSRMCQRLRDCHPIIITYTHCCTRGNVMFLFMALKFYCCTTENATYLIIALKL